MHIYTYVVTIDDLHMQFDIVIIISTENKTCTVQSQCTNNSAAIYMMVLKVCTGMYVFHENWDIS